MYILRFLRGTSRNYDSTVEFPRNTVGKSAEIESVHQTEFETIYSIHQISQRNALVGLVGQTNYHYIG